MKTLDPDVAEKISDLEMELSTFALHPEFIRLDSTVGPYTMTRIWFDDLDGSPTLGVTYREKSVKNDKELTIFKPVRIGTPASLVDIWRGAIFPLVQKIAKQDRRGGEVPEEIQTLTQELQTR